jgi:LasA protease
MKQLRPLLLLFVLSCILSVPVLAQITNEEQTIGTLARSAVVNENMANTRDMGEVVASDIRVSGAWAYGMVVTKVPESVHGTPEIRVFVARHDGVNWQVALEYTPEFGEWLAQAPSDLMPLNQRMTLSQAASTQRSAPRGNGDSRLSLPFPENQSWVLSGGPHGDGGNSNRPWTALDLARDTISGEVRAAREGVVYRTSSCPNFIRIDHAEGWQTGYYHIMNEQVNNGDSVQRGQLIGYSSNGIGCGGWSSGPHVHFTLRRWGSYLNIAGHDIGGWTVYEGSAAYEGCLMRVRDEYWRCRGTYIYNDGSIGSGYVDKRYDFNRDRKPDLWAVNMRDAVTNSSAVQIASGANLTTSILNTRTGMPQQPAFLNTAFAAGDYDNDGYSDLWVIHRLDGSETTALRIMGGRENFAYLYLNTATALPPYDNSVSFAVADYNRDTYPDLWAIIPRDEARNSVSVKIVAGPTFQTVLVDRGTAATQVSAYKDINFAAADYNNDGIPDLWMINPRRNNTTSVGVNILSGKDWQTTLYNGGTPFRMLSTNINTYGFVVADYNRDSYPDLWWVDRKKQKVRIVSGKDFETLLYTGNSIFPKTNSLDWHIIGSDRARETLLPLAPVVREPFDGIVFNTPHTTFVWEPSGLAAKYVLTVRDGAGNLVLQKPLNDGWKYCKTELCSVSTEALSWVLQDNRQYVWSITASNAYGANGSFTRSFTTDIPGASALQMPISGAVIDYNDPLTQADAVELIWGTRVNADFYKLVVKSPANSFVYKKKVLTTDCSVESCTFSLPGPLAAGEYKWFVNGRNLIANGVSKSEVWTFSVTALEDGE